MKNSYPYVSVIVLNYEGEKVITGVINSLMSLDYPKDKYEVIVVDNNSSDKSPEILNKLALRNNNLRLIPLPKNYGFSRGNNFGIRQAKGDYIALLNNDCIVTGSWLKNLVKTARKNPDTFAVASKILLYQKYLQFEIKVDHNLTHFFSYVSKSALYNLTKKRLYLNFQNKNQNYFGEIPYDPVGDKEIEVEFVFSRKKGTKSKNLISLVGFPRGFSLISCKSKEDEIVYKISINLKSETAIKNTVSKIQNAGIIPFQDGYARDIGAIVKYGSQYYEYDEGQYDKEKEVYAFCGAAALIDRKILNKIGLLDETFFMYYEDVELSERARLKGYKIYYSPKAEVRHIHALSSKEGSKFFVYHVEKGRLLHVFYNYTQKIFYGQFFKVLLVIAYGITNILMSLRYLKAISRDRSLDKPNLSKPFQLSRVLSYFVINSLYLYYVKLFIKRTDSVSVDKNIAEIYSGRWYFN